MKVTRIYTGPDGESHFDDIEIRLEDAGEIGRLSQRYPATGIVFRENDADYNYDWHTPPQRQYVIVLDGEIEIEVSDGTKRRFHGGDIFLAEDMTGRGHKTRVVNNQPRKSIFVTLD
jgi:hypothetical protein